MNNIQYRRDLWKLLPFFQGLEAVEIGVAEGYFSADMLSWPINFAHVYMVDRWKHMPNIKGDSSLPQEWHDKNFAAAMERVRPYGNRAVPLRGESSEMAGHIPNGTIALLYIDADHSYQGVMNDLRVWVPKVMPGGVVALHDYENTAYGVKRAVMDFCKGRYSVKLIPEDKPEDAGAWFRC